jgi:hypothetical protein
MRRLERDVMMMSKGSRRRARAAFLLAGWVLLGAGATGSRAASWPPPLAAAGAASSPTQDAAAPPATPIQEGLASIRGVLYRSDEITRIKGATVTAINTRTGRRYVSGFTGENGAYEVKELPAGTYDIAIESSDRLYVTDSLVDLAEKQRLYLSFALQAKGSAAAGAAAGAAPGATPDSAAEKGHAKVTFTDPNAVPATQEPPKKKSFWHSAGGIAIITVLVGGALAAGISAQHN